MPITIILLALLHILLLYCYHIADYFNNMQCMTYIISIVILSHYIYYYHEASYHMITYIITIVILLHSLHYINYSNNMHIMLNAHGGAS